MEREPENIFRSIFGLQCQFLAAGSQTPEAWAERLASRWGDSGKRGEWERSFEPIWFACGAALAPWPLACAKVLAGFSEALNPKLERDDWVRGNAVEALGRLGLADALPLLKNALNPKLETDDWVRRDASEALGRLGLPDALPLLKDALNPKLESSVPVRRNAAEALGRLGLPDALPLLNDALNPKLETDEWVRRDAAEALAAIAFRIEHAAHCRPSGKYAACLYEIPKYLKPPWR